jgi:hypothetical protein
MGWAVGFDSNWDRDIGYGVPAECDHPDCSKQIDRGLGYVCGGDVYGGEEGCGLFFCGSHLAYYQRDDGSWSPQLCERCGEGLEPFDPKPDVHEWILWKACHPSWKEWRWENPAWCWSNVTLGFWLLRQYWAIWDAGCRVWDKVRWSRIGRKWGL